MTIVKIAFASLLLSIVNLAEAESWTTNRRLVLVQPLVGWSGGAIRVVVDVAVNTSSCGNSTVLDFVFSGGTQESRSAVVAALYMALAADKQVNLYLSDSCSPAGAPVITGLSVLN